MGDPPKSHLSDAEWEWVSRTIPIACVDILPIQRSARRTSMIGLIRRDSPMGEKWCHLGGRVLYQESLTEAARRHLNDSLGTNSPVETEPEPYFVNQYFPFVREGTGYDPRKHAVAACFLAFFPESITPVAQGTEAKEFRWFSVDGLPQEDDLWPGTSLMIERALTDSDELVTYEALSARCNSHNELLWQTPVLAMTAMAFLLTIALSENRDWMRALAAALSTTIALISAQLMAKHSSSQLADTEELLRIERRRHMLLVHSEPADSAVRFSVRNLRPWFASKKSRVWWFYAMLLFAGVSAAVCILATFHV